MAEVTFEAVAYSKIVFHAAKYPHCAVNGLLLANSSKCKEPNKMKELLIVDAIPLFHLCLHVSPMVEIALTQVDSWAAENGLTIVGYYTANESFNDNTIERTSASSLKVGEKIAENFSAAIFAVVDNRKMSHNSDDLALNVWQHIDGKWKPHKIGGPSIYPPDSMEFVSGLLRQGSARNIVDFDNYLDDVTQDWTNKDVEKDVKELVKICEVLM